MHRRQIKRARGKEAIQRDRRHMRSEMHRQQESIAAQRFSTFFRLMTGSYSKAKETIPDLGQLRVAQSISNSQTLGALEAQNTPSSVATEQAEPPVQKEQVEQLDDGTELPKTPQEKLNDELKEFIKHYPQLDSLCTDSRIYINFSRDQLIKLLELFASIMNYDRGQDELEPQNAPFFGYTETCFKAFIIYALNQRELFIHRGMRAIELQRSLAGKCLIRNLLHTASTFDDVPRGNSNYITDPEIKACYLRVFRNACEEIVFSAELAFQEGHELSRSDGPSSYW